MAEGEIDRAPIVDDIRKLNLGRHQNLRPEVLTSSWPCTAISLASPRGLGIRGKRSDLIYEVFRLLDECVSIKIVFLENTPVVMKRGLKEIIDEFGQRGFSLAWGIFSASDVGAPQTRRRWFAMAYKGNIVHTIRNISVSKLSFDWSREPVPRIIPRGNPKIQPYSEIERQRYARNIKNLRMLGNSLVPQTVAFAINSLLAATSGSLGLKNSTRTPLHTIAIHSRNTIQYYQKPSQLRPMPGDIHIHLTGLYHGHPVEYNKTFWATPAGSHVWYQYDELSERSTFLLSNQIFYEDRTRELVKINGDKEHRLDKRWMINPEFVTWLMGIRRGWTSLDVYNNKSLG